MSTFLTPQQVAAIHGLQSDQPLRDPAALAGAVDRARTGWGDLLLYPDLSTQAAVLLLSVCQAQAFIDGNKRTAWVACDVFLAVNGGHLAEIPDSVILRLMSDISTRTIDEEGVASWLRSHLDVTRPRTEGDEP